jgi:rare lipoprotein A
MAVAPRRGMSVVRALAAAIILAPLALTGCAGGEEAVGEEDSALTGSALTGTMREGVRLSTTARVNFREGPSKSETVLRVLPIGTKVTALGGAAENGYYNVEQNGEEGWVFGAYLKAASGAASASDDDDDSPVTPGGAASRSGTGTGKIETCKASFYSEGQQTANGERFNPSALTAAHKTLKFNTMVRVTNTGNGKTVDVRINDRGPFVAGRCIDLSRAAFTAIASTSAGVASVSVEVLK